MGESNESWGAFASYDQELADVWDGYTRLPEHGENLILDAFCDRKRLTIAALLRLGTRLDTPTGQILAFASPGGIKYRDMVTDRRWSYEGSEWQRGMKIIKAGAESTRAVLIAEGETDGARLADLYDLDVAVMPAGAKFFPPTYAEQVAGYEQVLAALDKDEAGAHGLKLIMEALPHAQNFPAPGDGDWCEADHAPALPSVTTSTRDEPMPALVSAGHLVTLEPPDVVSWLEGAVLPVGGLMVIHGWVKSFKSYLALDLLGALAQGQDWATLEPAEEAAKVAVIQYEIPWPFYQARIIQQRAGAADRDLFDRNFYTWTPLHRPELVAGNRKQEAHVISSLVDAGVSIVMVDPIRRAGGAIDMNSEQEVRKVLQMFEHMQDAGLTVVATHHDNKTSARTGGGEVVGMTGSGAWAGDPDTLVSIELPFGEDIRTSTIRNLHFTLRNGPGIPPKAMSITEDGRMLYSGEAYTSTRDDGEPAI